MDTAYPPSAGNNSVEKKSFKDRLPKLPLLVWLVILFFSALVVSAGIYIAVSPNVSLKSIFSKLFRTRQEEVKNIWTPYTTTPPPIGHGVQTYKVSGGTEGLPRITEVILDPEDPELNSSQTIIVKANYPSPIKEVEVVLHTDDYKDTPYLLQLSSGTNTDGEWKGTWKVVNPYNYIYRVTVKVKNEQNLVQMATISLR